MLHDQHRAMLNIIRWYKILLKVGMCVSISSIIRISCLVTFAFRGFFWHHRYSTSMYVQGWSFNSTCKLSDLNKTSGIIRGIWENPYISCFSGAWIRWIGRCTRKCIYGTNAMVKTTEMEILLLFMFRRDENFIFCCCMMESTVFDGNIVGCVHHCTVNMVFYTKMWCLLRAFIRNISKISQARQNIPISWATFHVEENSLFRWCNRNWTTYGFRVKLVVNRCGLWNYDSNHFLYRSTLYICLPLSAATAFYTFCVILHWKPDITTYYVCHFFSRCQSIAPILWSSFKIQRNKRMLSISIIYWLCMCLRTRIHDVPFVNKTVMTAPAIEWIFVCDSCILF